MQSWIGGRTVMFRRKLVLAQGLCEEKSVYDSLNKLIAAQAKVSEQQLRWAKAEENTLFLSLFGRLAEISWMGNELLKQFQDKQTEMNRVFRDIDQEERIVDESRKALLTCEAKYMKLLKQMEHSKKKNDTAKVQSLEIELTTQGSLREHLKESVENQSQKLELYKIDLLKKGLHSQAETYLEIALNYQALFNAQLQLADMLPLEPPSPQSTPQEARDIVSGEMKMLLSQVTESLHLYPPKNGGINVKKLSESGQSPPSHRRSSTDDAPLRMGRSSKAHHSISQPVLVGHNHSSPLEETPPSPRNFPRPLPKSSHLSDAVVNSGEYCEIDLSSGMLEPSDSRQEYTQIHLTRRSPFGLRRTQSGTTTCNPSSSAGNQKKRQMSKNRSEPHDLRQMRNSVLNEENSASATSSSSEDLSNERETQEPPRSVSRGSDECYANPVDAIKEFLQGKEVASVAVLNEETHKGAVESTAVASPVKSVSEELLPTQPLSKEQQLRLFHERLFKDATTTADSEGTDLSKDVENEDNEYSNIDDEPTYSNPFDALSASAIGPLKVTTENLKRNISMSHSAWQLQQQGLMGKRNSPPPIPPTCKDEKQVAASRKPIRYTRRGSGESEGGGGSGSPGSSASASPVQLQAHAWERREPVWKRKNSNRGNDEIFSDPSPTHMIPGGDKPQAPVSVSERLRQLRQRSQSDGVVMDEARLQSRPPMPLPIPEQATAEFNGCGGQVKLNGHAHQAALPYSSAGDHEDSRKVAPVDMEGTKKKRAWLERANSDYSMTKVQSVYYVRRGSAQVVPLSAKEIVKQHMSHV